MLCPGSLNLIETLPVHERDSKPSMATATGTVGHDLAAQLLLKEVDATRLWHTMNKIIECQGFNVKVDELLINNIQSYVEYVLGYMEGRGPSELHVEQMVDCLPFDDRVRGTADAFIIHVVKKLINAFDYKNGRIKVSKHSNQFRWYAIGILMKCLREGKEVNTIRIHKIQPNVFDDDGEPEEPQVVEWNADALMDWFFNKGIPAINRTEDPNAPRKPGARQCKWCPGKHACPEYLAPQQNMIEELKLQPPPGMEEFEPASNALTPWPRGQLNHVTIADRLANANPIGS
jgi:hypothetical protein